MYCPRNAVCVITRTRSALLQFQECSQTGEIIHKEIRRKLPFYVSLNLVKHGGVFSFSFRWENNPKTTDYRTLSLISPGLILLRKAF